MPFTKETAKIAGKKGKRGGTKNKSTIVKEKLGVKNIEDLKDKVLNVWAELLQSNDEDNRKFASKEISKYVFPTKKESVVDLTVKGNVTILTVKPAANDE